MEPLPPISVLRLRCRPYQIKKTYKTRKRMTSFPRSAWSATLMLELKTRIHVSDPQIAGDAAIKDVSLFLKSRLTIFHSEPFFQLKR